MMKLAICNETYSGWEHARVCADVAAAGYDGLELSLAEIDPDPSRIDEEQAAGLGAVARCAGLEVVGLHWLLAQPPGLHLTSEDAAVRGRTTGHLVHLARLCAAAGGSLIVLGSPYQRNVPEGTSPEDGFSRLTDACREVAEAAGPLGVTLALEPLAPSVTNVLTTARETLRLIDAVGHPACRLHLDASALQAEDRAVAEIVSESARELVHVHVNDPVTLGGPGSGAHDHQPLLSALHRVDYDGYLSVEVFVQERDGPRIARDSLAYLRAALARLSVT